MIVVISGSRFSEDYYVLNYVLSQLPITYIIIANGKGIDRIAEIYAISNNIPYSKFETEWIKYKGGAGTITNKAMLTMEPKPDMLIAFPGPNSVGTWDAVRQATQLGIPNYTFNVTDCYTKVNNRYVLIS
jgi:hypothetical protein